MIVAAVSLPRSVQRDGARAAKEGHTSLLPLFEGTGPEPGPRHAGLSAQPNSTSRSAACLLESDVSRTRNRASLPSAFSASGGQRASNSLVHHGEADDLNRDAARRRRQAMTAIHRRPTVKTTLHLDPAGRPASLRGSSRRLGGQGPQVRVRALVRIALIVAEGSQLNRGLRGTMHYKVVARRPPLMRG